MKKLFPGFYLPTEEDFKRLWDECVFVFDASMLLNIYRYSPETQTAFLTILEKLKDRIWLPHQVAFEFSKNRGKVIEDQLKAYGDVEKTLDDIYLALEQQLSSFKRHSSISIAETLASVKSGLDAAKGALAKNKEGHRDFSVDDPVGDKLEKLIAGKVGPPFAKEKLVDIYGDGELRYKLQQPPGYMDTKGKPGNDKYGDLLLWRQVIEYAKKEHKPIILVTGENKEDWWHKEKGKIVSPRPELINEIHDQADVGFYLYQSAQFLEYAQKYLNLEGEKTAVEEAEEISRLDEAVETAVNYIATKDWIDRRLRNNFGALDNVLLRRASEATNLLNNPLMRQAIESAQLFNKTFQNPLLRRALDDFNEIKTPFITQKIEHDLATRSAINRHLDDVSRLANDPLARRAAEFSQMFDNPTLQRIKDAQAAFTDPFLTNALETGRFWYNHPLRGFPIPRDIDVEISPKRSSDLPNSESGIVRVELTLPDDENDNESDASQTVDANPVASPPYEFDDYPRVITLTHRATSSHPFETSHRLRRPTTDEWIKWGQSIKRVRRYLSQAEIDEHNADREEDEKASEIWSPIYSEWEANELLYNKIVLEIAGIQLDDNDEFPRDQFRVLPPEMIEELQFEIKSAAIKPLYECYCELEASDTDQTRRIKQELAGSSSSSHNVVHILRTPTESQSVQFRTSIVTGEFAQDDEGREIINLRLNLSVANDFYSSLLERIENATVSGEVFSVERRHPFMEAINPVYKLRVLETLFGVRAWYFAVEDMVFP